MGGTGILKIVDVIHDQAKNGEIPVCIFLFPQVSARMHNY